MKKTISALLATGLISCALFSHQAQANTISIGDATVTGAVSPFSWSYTGTTFNSYFDPAQPTTVKINGFAGFNGVTVDPAGWTFFGYIGGNLIWHWTGAAGAIPNATSYVFTAQSIFGLKVLGSYNTLDRSSAIAGNPPSTSTGPTSVPSAPDGGSAVTLLGIALAGIEGARRFIRSRKA